MAFNPMAQITEHGNCLTVGFGEGQPRFLWYLALYENAPTIRKSDKMEVGLGPFYPVSFSYDKIVLKRTKSIDRAYNTIVIYKYTGKNDSNLANHNISDFNRIPVWAIPKWVKRDYLQFENVMLHSVVMIINCRDPKLRALLYNCVDFDSLRRAFYPSLLDFTDIQNILPLGIPGARPGKPPQECRRQHSAHPFSELVFLNVGADNDMQMGRFWEDFSRQFGMKVSVRRYPEAELFKSVFSYPRKYNLIIVSMDAVRPDPSAFFDYMVRDEGYFDFKLTDVDRQYAEFRKSSDQARRTVLGGEIADLLEKNHVVLPLLQVKRKFYYPPGIKNLVSGRGFLEYPEIGYFRW